MFFGILEIYAREFRTDDGWHLNVTRKYLKEKLHKRQETVILKCLEFIATNGERTGGVCDEFGASLSGVSILNSNSSETRGKLVENSKKVIQNSGKWDLCLYGERVLIYVPKFRELLDESTLKKLREKERSFRNCSGSVPKNGRTDIDIDKDIPPISPKGGKVGRSSSPKKPSPEQIEKFNQFYAAYPKKVAKQDALKAWVKLSPENGLYETIMTALEVSKQSQGWTKDGGQFIPNPATWINGRRWEDGGAESPRRPTW